VAPLEHLLRVRPGQGIDALEASKLFKQNEAALVTKANLREATVVVLGYVEQMLANAARQLFNRAVVTIWDDRCDLHTVFRPFKYISCVGRQKA